MKRLVITSTCVIILAIAASTPAAPKPDAPPAEPGDAMIHAYLSRLAVQLDAAFTQTLPAADEWDAVRRSWRQEYLYMLGLDPMPQPTPLHPVITGTLQRDGYTVDRLCFQSLPGLYVTANLYRPADVPAGDKLPAVLYVCGHGHRGPEGVKTSYQCQPIWFAKHGYVCLIVDTLDRGEVKSLHRGLYSEGRRWWLSRGYTPAGVECLNGMRAIDYLISRPDVDPERIAVTGISGGGAATFWIAAADERVKAAVPVSGMADLQAYVADNKTDVHCDCMLLPNAFAWPWTRIAALVAPRPLLFVNSDNDRFFPMDANERIINRLERLYGILGAGDMVDSVMSVGDHAYRKDIRQAIYRFINTHLKNDPSVVTDSEQDLYEGEKDDRTYPIDLQLLRVYADEKDLPADQINTTIDERFVPMAKVEPPATGQFDAWKHQLLAELRRVTFRALPERILPAERLDSPAPGVTRLSSEDGIEFRLIQSTSGASAPKRIILAVSLEDDAGKILLSKWLMAAAGADDAIAVCQPRGVGQTRWNTASPPNRVERQFALIGQTLDTARVRDIIAAARYLAGQYNRAEIHLAGEKAAGVLAAYAALLEPEIAGVIVQDPPATHMEPAAPQFLNVLRVCDIPDALGMIAPRPLSIAGETEALVSKVKTIYTAAGASNKLTHK
jgi:dienelactone hydrolase